MDIRKIVFPTVILILISIPGRSQTEVDTTDQPLFELSFGQSILFISESKIIDVRNEAAVVLPTSSFLFFAELRPLKTLRIPFYLNLPTETKQFLIDGVLINEKAKPSFGAGVEFKIFGFAINQKTNFELEAGPLVNVLISQNERVVISPVSAVRLRLVKANDFVMYLGSSYSLGINSFGLLYGTGFIFYS